MKGLLKYLLIGIGILSLLTIAYQYNFFNMDRWLMRSSLDHKEVIAINNSGHAFSINNDKLIEYYLRFSDLEDASRLANSGLLDKAKIEISLVKDKPSPQGLFYSMPPDFSASQIAYTRNDVGNTTYLDIFIDDAILIDRNGKEINRIIELQILRCLYMITHPEILGSQEPSKNIFDQIAIVQSEIGELIN